MSETIGAEKLYTTNMLYEGECDLGLSFYATDFAYIAKMRTAIDTGKGNFFGASWERLPRKSAASEIRVKCSMVY